MTKEQIEYMVNRFLGYKLPENFNPDGGVIFEPIASKGTTAEHKREPSGTNLLDFSQAEDMVRYILDGVPSSNIETGWLIDDGRMCLGICGGKFRWTVYTDPNAIRFSRKEDADNAISGLRDTYKDFPQAAHAVDHMWC